MFQKHVRPGLACEPQLLKVRPAVRDISVGGGWDGMGWAGLPTPRKSHRIVARVGTLARPLQLPASNHLRFDCGHTNSISVKCDVSSLPPSPSPSLAPRPRDNPCPFFPCLPPCLPPVDCTAGTSGRACLLAACRPVRHWQSGVAASVESADRKQSTSLIRAQGEAFPSPEHLSKSLISLPICLRMACPEHERSIFLAIGAGPGLACLAFVTPGQLLLNRTTHLACLRYFFGLATVGVPTAASLQTFASYAAPLCPALHTSNHSASQ